jgi:hypothetical protein
MYTPRYRTVTSTLLLALVASGCGLAASVAPGPGVMGGDAKKRLALVSANANTLRTAKICGLATASGEFRGLRKCNELTFEAVTRHDAVALELAKPALARLETTGDPCESLPEAAKVWTAMDAFDKAAELEVKAARTCESAMDATRAALAFSRGEHCVDALAICREGWAWAKTEREQMALMDQVARCSDATSADANFAFVPAPVMARYQLLLKARAAKRQANAAQDEADDRVFAAQQAATAARLDNETRKGDCGHECSKTGNQCQSNCGGDMPCRNRCQAIERVCLGKCN